MRTCSPDAARSSRSSIVSSMPIVSQTSLRWNEGSTCKVTEMRRPVLPRPQREAVKRSGFTVWEHSTSVPFAKSRPRARTWVEITPKPMPDPCVAVVITPARVWSDIEPRLDIARPWAPKAAWSLMRVMPASTTTKRLCLLICLREKKDEKGRKGKKWAVSGGA